MESRKKTPKADNLFSIHMDKISTLKVLSDKQIGTVMRLLIEYQEKGENETISEAAPIMFAFEILKQSLDALNQKRKGFSKSQSGNAHKRWQKKRADAESCQDMPRHNSASAGTVRHNSAMPKDAYKAKAKAKETVKEKVVVDQQNLENSKPPPPLLEIIKSESQFHGFFIDAKVARKFQACGIDPSWFSGKHSFLAYCSAIVKKKYPGRNIDELKPLFISAVNEWEDIREAYPQWRKQREKEDAARLKKDARERALAAIPKSCPKCGTELGGRLCCSMHGWFDFQEETLEYVFIESGKGEQNFSIMFENFRSGKKAAR